MTPYIAAPAKEIGDVIGRTPPYAWLATDASTSTRISFWFTSDIFLKRLVLSNQDSYIPFLRGSLQAKVNQKGLLIVLEESHEEYLQLSLQWYSALSCSHEHKPHKPQRRVRWGACYERFHSKEGLHFCIEQSARNRSCHRTSNNQPLFTSLEIPWELLTQAVLRYLAEAYVTQESESLRIFVSKKGMIRDCQMHICMRNLQ